ncbi:MAG: choice-of-anchor D domain-containing protein, partial [bacterium]|nr:choice-of-anchor D domain-containing protein [bacterium]
TKVALLWLGQELDSAVASANTPSVQFLAPAAGDQWEGTGERAIRWAGNDTDGDSLLYSLFYSHDDGQSWSVLAVDLTDTQLNLEPALIRGGSRVRFRVIATDGFHSGETTVGPINVIQQPQIAVGPQPVDLGEAVVGQAVEGVVVVRNPGTGPLQVESVVSDSELFEVLSPDGPFSVTAGGSRAVVVRYSPGSQGADAGALTIISDAAGQPELAVTVEGAGTDGQTPRIRLESEAMNFLRLPAGQTSTAPLLIENRSLV